MQLLDRDKHTHNVFPGLLVEVMDKAGARPALRTPLKTGEAGELQ